MHRHPALLVFLSAAALEPACSPRYIATEDGPQAYYQTAYPKRDVSGQLEQVFRSVKRAQVTGFYDTYRFALADSITAEAVGQRGTYRRATERFSFDRTRVGTATIVSVSGGHATLVTDNHVTTLPDTIVVYHSERGRSDPEDRPGRFVESVSIRTSSRYLVIGLPDNRPFTVQARDSAADVAVLDVRLPDGPLAEIVPVLTVPVGNPARLSLGSFVYVLGYPRGFQMVTRGIVSEPDRSRDHSFLLDGLFNRGISGGLILAVRGEGSALEWVGMARSAASEPVYSLLPEYRALAEEDLTVPYEGRLYLQRTARIDYGITFTVPVNVVQQVLRQAGVRISAPGP